MRSLALPANDILRPANAGEANGVELVATTTRSKLQEMDMLTRISTTALLALLGFCASSQGEPLPTNADPDMMKRVLEQGRLQGEWLPKFLLTKDGIEPYPLKGRTLEFADNTFTLTEGRRRVQAGTFSLDPSSRGLDLIVERHDAWDVGAAAPLVVPHALRCG